MRNRLCGRDTWWRLLPRTVVVVVVARRGARFDDATAPKRNSLLVRPEA